MPQNGLTGFGTKKIYIINCKRESMIVLTALTKVSYYEANKPIASFCAALALYLAGECFRIFKQLKFKFKKQVTLGLLYLQKPLQSQP